jgi:hypothetical protein
MVTFADLVQRSAELKRELLKFSDHPRFDRERRQVLREHFGDHVVGDESELVSAIDYFVLKHKLRGGTTVLERFVAGRPDLSESDRELLLGWRDVVEGAFEVQCRDGDALVVENLVDELSYRVYSNMGPGVFAQLQPGYFMIGRLVPIGSEWLVSGDVAVYPDDSRAVIYHAAYELAMQHPAAVFRNPAKLALAQQMSKDQHTRFVEFFGTDLAVIPGTQLTDRMLAFYRFCREKADPSGADSADLPVSAADYPAEPVDSEAVAVFHDEIDGLSLCAGFGRVERAFADPALLRQPEYRRRLREYLDDDTIPPQVFERMVARDPERGNEVFRKLLGQKAFNWSISGDALMRRRKPSYYDTSRLPGMIPVSAKLAPYATPE